MLDEEAVRQLLRGKSRVTPRLGRYVGFEGQQALVDMGDQRFPVPFLTGFVPQINEPVHVWSVDGSPYLVGPTAPKPGVGVVSTVAGDYVTVDTEFGSVRMPFAGEALTSGDTVGISWSTQPWCVKLSTSPDPVAPPPAPGSGSEPQVRSAEFRAIDAGSTDRGSVRWWTAHPYASNSTYGAYFYGSQIKDTIPAHAQYVGLEFYVSYQQRQGGAPRFALHDNGWKAGIPGFWPYFEWAPPAGWNTPPDPVAWFDALKAGGSRWGVGFNQGGYNIFRSLAQDGLSGAIRITWRA